MTKRRGLSFDEMIVGLLFVVVALRAFLMAAHSDTYWQLRAGQDIWATGHVPRVDSYSYTAAGAPWPDHEWLWQALVYVLHRAGGMPLLTTGGALIVLGAVALAYRLMTGTVATRFVLLLLAIPLASVVWALRPQILTLLGLVVLARLLARERFVALPVLFLVWANAHGGVALGGVLLVVAFLTAVARARLCGEAADGRRALWLGVMLPLCALAIAATPLGFGIFRFVAASEARLREAHINEWRPALPGLSIAGAFWILALGFIALLARRLRSLRAGPWSDWVIVACAVALLPLAFRSLRHIGPFLMLAPVAASRLLGAGFRLRRGPAPASPDHPRLNATFVGVLAAGAVATVALAWRAPLEVLNWRPLPPAVLAAVRACPGPLYNHYNEGGYLIWFLPERKVFVDNRQDPYPLALLLEHVRVESGQLPHGLLFERFGVRCSFLGADSPTVAALSREGWRSLYRDDKWAVQEAPPPR
jgi:hypothetical protein